MSIHERDPNLRDVINQVEVVSLRLRRLIRLQLAIAVLADPGFGDTDKRRARQIMHEAVGLYFQPEDDE